MILSFRYITEVSFAPQVGRHTILLRCLPALTPSQSIRHEAFSISDGFSISEQRDGFGNRIMTGNCAESHAKLYYSCSGEVCLSTYCIPDADPHAMYSLPSALTIPDHDIVMLMPVLTTSFLDNCIAITHAVHKSISYIPGTTAMSTTAAEALRARQGVCQDFAHIMLVLCREAGYPARYVCGLMKGEGATHAWVEVHDGQCWYAFDPTNDTAIATGYIKMAHGRDALDCPVIRGIYTGITQEATNIKVIVNEK